MAAPFDFSHRGAVVHVMKRGLSLAPGPPVFCPSLAVCGVAVWLWGVAR